MADCSAIEARLEAARAAYDALVLGGAVRKFVDQNGEAVEYTSANSSKLLSYIHQLENALAVCQGSVPAVSGPLRFTFGRPRLY